MFTNSATVELNAEQAVLGAALIDPDCIRALAGIVREEDFTLELHRLIWRTMLSMQRSGERIDALTAADRLSGDGVARDFLAELVTVTPTSANAPEYAAIVAAAGKRRRLRTALENAIKGIDERRAEDEIFPAVEAAIDAYDTRSRSLVLSPTAQSDAFYAFRREIDGGKPPYTRTGLAALDRMLGGGLLHGALYFLAARPGTGKTALALNIADHVAEAGKPVLFVSMEMTPEQIMSRRLSTLTRIDSQQLLMRPLSESDYADVAEGIVKLGARPLHLTAEGSLSVDAVATLAHAYHGLGLIVADHFTLFARPHRQQDFSEYAEISHRLKDLALRLRVPVLCLIQVSREDGGGKKRARLDTLRGSGATEEDAAGVMFLERSNTDDTEGAPREETVVLEKNRFGPTGSISLSYAPKFNLFREVADSKAIMRKFADAGRAAKDRNRVEAMQQTFEEITESGEGMPF